MIRGHSCTRKILILVLVILISCQENSNSENQKLGEVAVRSEIERFLDETGIPSVSYVLIKNGEIADSGAVGYANARKRIPVDTKTYFNHGSNFKSVTATAIMQLQEKGLLDIDAPVNHYLRLPFKSFDPQKPITTRHLMSHQSGIPTSVILNKLWHFRKDANFEEILEKVEPNTVPEEKFQYANDGFVLLAKLIEDVTGESYETYVRENILWPLDIYTVGYVTPTPEMVENLALPYHIRFNKAYPTHQLIVPQYPSGSVYLTPSEMARFLVMHLNKGNYQGKSILKKESVEAMHTPNIKVDEGYRYGLGFGIEQINGKEYSFHQGSLPGYLSAHRMDFESRSAVYLSTNVSASPLQERQIQRLLDFLMDYIQGNQIAKMEIPLEESMPDTKPKPLDLNEYVGNYKIENTDIFLTVEKIGAQLFLINPAGERFRIESFNRYEFFLTTENENITFEQEDGSIGALFLGSGESKYKASKE